MMINKQIHKGLTTNQVFQIREKTGFNILPKDKKITWLSILFSQLKSPVIYILFIVSFISLLYKEYFDFILIESVIVLNVIMGFIQEYKAFRTSESLKKLITPQCIVIRDGIRKKLNLKFIVPEDIVVLGAGDKIPADGILLEGKSFLVKESILTGEEEAISKNAIKDNKLFMGTDVISGEGLMKVQNIGKETQLGQIGKSLITIESVKTPLQVSLEKLSKELSLFILILCSIIFVIGVLIGNKATEMIRISVILSIAAIPEGLPIALTVILSIAANRILKQKGLIKKLLSVETLGSTTVLCLDKTGTLTEGDMKVVKADFINEERIVSATILSNEQRTNLEVALWEYIKKNYIHQFNKIHNEIVQKYEEPFTSERKYSLTVGQLRNKEFAYVIGAPDIIIKFCDLSSSEKINIEEKITNFTKAGLRLIAFASKEGKDLKNLDGFKWDGIIAIEDPLRVEARETIELAQKAGLKVKIITGDHKATAIKIANELNLNITKVNVIEGSQLDKLPEKDLKNLFDKIILFTRVTPHHKLKIVQILQKKGEIVAMTGDGVNDAQALKRADIGIVMGNSSDLAKESGDLILMDNDFLTIIKAIEESRLVFANIKKVVTYVLSDSFVEIIIIFGAILLGLPMPLTVAQILLIHLICDGPPDIALGFEPKDTDLMNHDNLHNKKGRVILDKHTYAIIIGVSIIIGILGLIVFYISFNNSHDLSLARTITFGSIATIDLIYIFSFKSLRYPIRIKGILNNKWLLGACFYGFIILIASLYLPFFNEIIETVPLAPKFLLLQIGIGLIAISWVEIVKFVNRKRC